MDLPPFPAQAPRNLLVGFSGGRDSTALLHRLARGCADGERRLRAVHVDHGLHPDAAQWAAHCVATAGALGLACAVRRVAVQPAGRGPEDAARRARYAAFAAERRDDETLVLAHHRDDQAETLLLALLRGSGERGLSAMRGFTDDARGPIWRPLLDVPSDAVAAYAAAQGLRWIEDPSNGDTRLARNAMRLAVLPLLRRHWPAVDAALAHSARRLADADATLGRVAIADAAALQGLAGDTLDADGLRALPPDRAARALRAWAESRQAGLTADAIERALGDWARHPPNRALQHRLGAHRLRQWGGQLWLTVGDALPPAPAPWDGRAELVLPDGSRLRLVGAPGFDAPVVVAARDAAPNAFHAAGQPRPRPLKAVFAALGVPPWARSAVPLLLDDKRDVLAVADLAYTSRFDAWLRERRARVLWQAAAAQG